MSEDELRHEPASALWEHFLRWGDFCMAYSTLQPALSQFVAEGIGYIAYATVGRFPLVRRPHRLVIGDPVCAAEDAGVLIDRFLAEGIPTSFIHVSSGTARLLIERGHAAGTMGMETWFDIRPLDLSGGRRARLRQWLHKAEREGVTVVESARAEIDTGQMSRVSSAWLARKGGRELMLLTRPLSENDEPLVRCFFAMRDGQLIGVVTFDPMCRDGRPVGYYTQHIRTLPGAPHGTSDLIIITAARVFAGEGAEMMSLGISPLSPNPAPEFAENTLYSTISRLVRRYGNGLYPFRGNDSHKRKYGARRRPSWICYRGLTAVELFRMVRATRLI